MKKEVGSPAFHLGSEDWKKISKGAVIALLGAVLTYSSDVFLQLDFGGKAPLVTAIWSVLVNVGWKWISSNETKK